MDTLGLVLAEALASCLAAAVGILSRPACPVNELTFPVVVVVHLKDPLVHAINQALHNLQEENWLLEGERKRW